MKHTVKRPQEIEIKFLDINIPVRYEEEDIPNDFPLRNGDQWQAVIDIDTGKIEAWPEGKTGEFYMKVCDQGCYRLLDAERQEVACINEDYVPHGLVPGEYGDYVEMKIDATGTITNWPKSIDIDLSEFFGSDESDN